MNRLVFSYMLNVLLMVLAGWAFIELYYFTIEVANFIQTERVPFEVSLSLMPLTLLLIFSIVSTILYKIQKKKYKKISYWMFPLLFPQEDEREKAITEKACRTTFMSLWYVLPCAVGFLTLSPIANLYVPAYPVYIAFSIFFIQMTIFHVSLYRNKIA